MEGDAHPAKLAVRDRRDRVISRLTESFARDELGLEAFESRIDAAYRAEAEADLDALVADLPDHAPSADVTTALAQPEIVPTTTLARALPQPAVRALFSNIERSGSMTMAGTVRAEAIFGNLELDLREARFGPGVTELHVRSVFGSIEITVPADITVEVHGTGIFGNFEGSTRTIADRDAPTLRIVGSSVFASIVIKTVPPLRVQRLAEQLRAHRLLPP